MSDQKYSVLKEVDKLNCHWWFVCGRLILLLANLPAFMCKDKITVSALSAVLNIITTSAKFSSGLIAFFMLCEPLVVVVAVAV